MTSGCLYASSEDERTWETSESRFLERRISSGESREEWFEGEERLYEVILEVASMKASSRLIEGVGGWRTERLR